MKKIIIFLLLIIINFIFINPVFATTEEEDLNKILDLIPNEYNLNVISSLEMDELKTNYYLFSSISKVLEENINESLYCFNDGCIFETSDIKLNIVNENKKYKLILTEKDYSISKNLELNINYIESNLEDEQSIKDSINYLKSKTNEFSDFNFSYINYEFITSPQILDEVSEKYGINFIKCSYAGSDIFSKDEQIVVYFHYDYIFIFKNDVLYKIIKDDVIIDNTKYMSQYLPKLNLNDYYDIEKYIDDAFIAFKERTGYTNSIIKENEDGSRYQIISTSNNITYYEVRVINLDDNVEWVISFNGKLKEKQEPLLGDMNNDGKITITDVIKLLKIYLGLE